jgi:mono/diheme cytochrome c family protein
VSVVARVVGVVVVVILLLVAAAAAYALWPAPPAPKLAMPPVTPELIKRGEYVATAADCAACHTVSGGAPYAGGRAFKLPFGTIYSPNITPDRATGIGDWSPGDLLRALHQGVGAHGRQDYPAFPYTSYVRISDEDAVALWAYLMSLKPVRAQVPQNSLAFPFNQRPLMRFWKLLFMPREGFRPDPSKSAEWNRGAYLVTGLAHCGECHTPRNILYGFSGGRALSGETIQGWTAWNITADPRHGVGAWSADDLVAYLRYGYAPNRGAASGPMKEAVDYSFSRLTPEDLHAIAVYLQSTRPIARGPVAGAVPPSLAASTFDAPGASEPDSAGRRLFAGSCAGCHAWNGEGRQTPIARLKGLKSVADPQGLNVVQAVLRGNSVSAPQGKASMPAFGRAYSDTEIADLGSYVVQHFGGQRSRVTPKQAAQARND